MIPLGKMVPCNKKEWDLDKSRTNIQFASDFTMLKSATQSYKRKEKQGACTTSCKSAGGKNEAKKLRLDNILHLFMKTKICIQNDSKLFSILIKNAKFFFNTVHV